MTQSVVVVKQKLEGVDLQNKTTFISLRDGSRLRCCVFRGELKYLLLMFVLCCFLLCCDGKVTKSNFN